MILFEREILILSIEFRYLLRTCKKSYVHSSFSADAAYSSSGFSRHAFRTRVFEWHGFGPKRFKRDARKFSNYYLDVYRAPS